ncbi:hypothetical protein C8R43DRAFT_640264 [Mycena crocata]|nr:hypothetical protein C8R43DRAFT_640264 [Mycena crocata]
MLATPGFRGILGKAWACRSAKLGLKDSILHELCGFISHSCVSDMTHVDEMVQGVGGSTKDLANLVVQYLVFIVQRPTSGELGKNASYIGGLLKFIRDVDRLFPPAHREDLRAEPLGKFCWNLMLQGFVTILTQATVLIANISIMPTAELGAVLADSLVLLAGCF